MARKYKSKRASYPSRSTSKRKKASYRKLRKYSSRKYSSSTGKGFLDKPQVRKALTIAIAIFGVGAVIGVIGIFAVLARYTASLPNPSEPFERGQAQSSRILDKRGELLYTIHGEEHREVVALEDLPDHMKWAILSAEDIDYYDRKTSIDILAFIRAAYYEATGTGRSGFSGITQQMLKNTVLSTERTYERKIKEVILTMQVESRYSKDEILQLYLNEVAFGGNNYGIKAAANAYFGKDPKDLTLAESALLAALPQAPSYYSPVFGGDAEAAKVRQEWILDQMLKHSDKTGVTEEEIQAAKEQELVYQEGRVDIKAPHFVFYVKQLLEDQYGYTTKEIEQGGLEVYTTLDYEMQKIAEEEVSAHAERLLVNYNAHNASLVTINPNTGEILAMVGSKDYWGSEEGGKFDGKVNVATALRQPGSSVKPYTYVTAFDQGALAPSTLLPDVEIEFPDYKPKNWDDKFYGPMDVRKALQLSRNIPAVKALDLVGIDPFIETAEKLGITTFNQRDQYGLSLTLGAADVKLLEHTAAYGVFATGGIRHPATAILKVVNNGEVEHEFKVEEGTRVLDEKPVYLLNHVMGQDNCYVDGVHARQCIDGYSTAGKTGTSNENRNLWFLGYTPDLVTGVWAGNNDNSITTYSSYGSITALPLWQDYMARVLPMTPGTQISRPSGIVSRTVCNASGQLATENCEGDTKDALFIDGKFPPEDEMYAKVELCKDQGLLATEADKAAGNVEEKIILRYKEVKDSWQPFLDKWMDAEERADQYKIPTEYCEGYRNPSGKELPWVIFDNPEHKAVVNAGDTITIQMRPISPHTITKVQVYFDGDLIDTLTSVPYEVEFEIPSDATSTTHEISATAHDSKGRKGSSYINVTVDNPGEPSDAVTVTTATSPTLQAKYTGTVPAVSGVYFYYEQDSKNTLVGQATHEGIGVYELNIGEGDVPDSTHKIFAVVRFKDPFEEDLQSAKVTVNP